MVDVEVLVVGVVDVEVLVVGVELELVDGGGGGGAAHDSVTPTIGPLTGSEIDDNGVPGGTLTVNVSLTPPSSVTVTVHVSADAVGSAAIASVTRVAPVAATAITSFRLLNTVAYLLPPSNVRMFAAPRGGDVRTTLLTCFQVCNAELLREWSISSIARHGGAQHGRRAATASATADPLRHCSDGDRGPTRANPKSQIYC